MTEDDDDTAVEVPETDDGSDNQVAQSRADGVEYVC